MSSNSLINDNSTDSKSQDEKLQPTMESINPTTIQSNQESSNSDSYTTLSGSDEDDDDDDDADDDGSDFPVGLTFEWLDEQMRAGIDVRPLLARILPGLPTDISQSALYEIFMDLFLPYRSRKALEQYKTFDDAVELIRTRKNIIVLTGAGISVSCGSKSSR